MSATIEGVITYPRQQDATEGTYLCDSDQGLTTERTAVECPYCHRGMWMLNKAGRKKAGRISRVAKVLEPATETTRLKVVVQYLPPRMRVLSCSRCEARFSVPCSALK